MSQDLRKAVQEVRESVTNLHSSLERLEASQRETSQRTARLEESARQTAETTARLEESARQTAEDTATVKRHFQTFLTRFDEIVEMLVTHDTEQLRRLAAVESENASLRMTCANLLLRVEVLERKAG